MENKDGSLLMLQSYDVWYATIYGFVILNPNNPLVDDKATLANDRRIRHDLLCALKKQEFTRIKNCKTTKEIWDFLKVAHEGNNIIKEKKIQLLKVQYEGYKMKEKEAISENLFRINEIVNNMKALGEEFKNFEVCKMILRTLNLRFNAKFTILKDKDLSQMKINDL
ncbi:uncharacterized protein LOC132270599 [Cornus florida]|uniref:uncharacterized protein LOC132270599 n=1 Tax=Cornus florida TaxID=4283 RepID=UPI0028A0AFD9|nr:uncharacterized protein LOC132270599 [Cornus florida]